jgi:hypothetical protein
MRPSNAKRVMIFAIHRTVDWWSFLGQNLGWQYGAVVTDLVGQGDISVVHDFYSELGRLRKRSTATSRLLSDEQVADVVSRCRTLRWQRPDLARMMVHAMAFALDQALEKVRPGLVLSFPIDRYVKDVLERLACARGIPYIELTASVLPGMSMLLRRGRPIRTTVPPDEAEVERRRTELAVPTFVPSYVQGQSTYNRLKYLQTYSYFRARAVAFRLISWLKRDPLNLHYLDAQPTLGHKSRLDDMRIIGYCDRDWRTRLASTPKSKRVLFGLQLFPEASIDYWIENLELIDNENVVIQAASAYSNAGFLVLVKDHPLQFGFRQVGLIERLRNLPNVVLVPYEVSGNELLSLVGSNFTCTGTLGMQAALYGLTSVVTDSYYSNEEDFIIFRSQSDLAKLPERTLAAISEPDLAERQRRIVRNLLMGSFDGDFFSFKGFDAAAPSAPARVLAKSLGRRLDQLDAEGCLRALAVRQFSPEPDLAR